MNSPERPLFAIARFADVARRTCSDWRTASEIGSGAERDPTLGLETDRRASRLGRDRRSPTDAKLPMGADLRSLWITWPIGSNAWRSSAAVGGGRAGLVFALLVGTPILLAVIAFSFDRWIT